MRPIILWFLAMVVLLAAVSAWADIMVYDRNGTYLGNWAGDYGGSGVRLFLPNRNQFVGYDYHTHMEMEIKTTKLFYAQIYCMGQPYIEVSSTPFNEIRKLTNSDALYVGAGNTVIYLNFLSYSDGSTCTNSSSVVWVMPAEYVPDGTVPLLLNWSRLPLQFKYQGPRVVVIPLP